MKPEIQELENEVIQWQAEIAKHRKKMKDIRNRIVTLFKEDKSIIFDDSFKNYENMKILIDNRTVSEFVKAGRLDKSNIKKYIIRKTQDGFSPSQLSGGKCLYTIAIIAYFEYLDMDECIDNITFFEREMDEIVEHRFKDIRDYLENHMGEDPKQFIKDFNMQMK
ncbi:hypothetical protein GQ472_02565 [archaeon]|nr:hypothetical protein [archaeon]